MELHVSLRGTLAEEYCSIRDQEGASAANAFLVALIARPSRGATARGARPLTSPRSFDEYHLLRANVAARIQSQQIGPRGKPAAGAVDPLPG